MKETLPASLNPESSTPVRASALTPVSPDFKLIAAAAAFAEPAAMLAVAAEPAGPVIVSAAPPPIAAAGAVAPATTLPTPLPARSTRFAPILRALAELI